MQFIQEHKVQNIDNYDDILKTIDVPFEKSQVYHVSTETKIVNEDKRLSEYRILYDEKLFKLAESLIKDINSKQGEGNKNFFLYKNDIMHIKYQAGGYFKEHEDYLSLTSNFVDEYSLIICINGQGKGGRTILKINDNFRYKSKATRTTGMSLLFRKDIQHEGEVLNEGEYKEILTFNVWSIEPDIKQILLVNFDNDERIMTIPVNRIFENKDNMLKYFLTSEVGGDKTSNIIKYKSLHSFEEFNVIYKIYNNEILSYNDIDLGKNIINYYLFNPSDFLIKTINEQYEFVKLKPHYVENSGNYIMFADQGLYLKFLDDVKSHHLPYVPFKMILGEGRLSFGGGMSDEDPYSVDMSPLYVTFSENNNIMFIRNIMGKVVKMEPDFYKLGKLEDYIIEDEIDIEYYNSIPDNKPFIFEAPYYDRDIRDDNNYIVGSEECFIEGNIIYYSLRHKIYDDSNIKLLSLVTSRVDKHVITKSTDSNGFNNGIYIINSDNKLVINEEHHNNIINKVKNIELYDQIIDNLNNIHIPNPQRSNRTESENYCNENVYGNFNLIFIYGFLKMDV